ncbi:MAG: hypothetical protein D6681_00415 [Calditrichaeota bacterium]|nr:MAG: hypothetical protein D6681_00415 [Calditrichota bacterium]
MIQNLDKVVEGYLQDGEEPFWYGQPPDEPAVKHLRPILAALGWFGIFFVVLAIFQLYYDLGGMEGLADFNRQISFSNLVAQCRYSLALLMVASGLFIVRGLLPKSVKEVNNTIYLVTDRRIAIIEHGDAPKIREFGPGEIRNPVIGESDPSNPQTQRVAFVQELRKMASGGNPHSSQAELHWDGFPFVKKEEAKEAAAAIQKWLKQHKGETTIENKHLNFRISLFKDWTVRTVFVEKNHRDNLLLSLLTCEFIDESNILPVVPSHKEWNTILMSRQIVAVAMGDYAESRHFKIVVEAALSHGAPDGIDFLSFTLQPQLLKMVGEPQTIVNLLKNELLICQLDNLTRKKKDGSYVVQIHPQAKRTNLNAMIGFDKTSSLSINGVEYRIRQVYTFQPFIRLEQKDSRFPPEPTEHTLHLRYTFLYSERHFRKEYNKWLNQIVQHTRILEDLSSPPPEAESSAREPTQEEEA